MPVGYVWEANILEDIFSIWLVISKFKSKLLTISIDWVDSNPLPVYQIPPDTGKLPERLAVVLAVMVPQEDFVVPLSLYNHEAPLLITLLL